MTTQTGAITAPPNPSQMLYEPCKLLEGLVWYALDNFTTEIVAIEMTTNGDFAEEDLLTEGLLIYLTETWEKAASNEELVGVMFIDFQEAY